MLSEEAVSIEETDKDSSEVLKDLSDNLLSGNFDVDFMTDIADYDTQLMVLGVLGEAGLQEDAGKISMLSSSLNILRVDDEKNDSVKLAERVAGGVTSIFSIFGSFSIMVGMLLIFLVTIIY